MRFPRLLLALVLFGILVGCGPVIYTVAIGAAERSVEEARLSEAHLYAPYEYYLASEHLRKAKEEAAEASYQDAIHFAEVAETHGTKARSLARRSRAEARH